MNTDGTRLPDAKSTANLVPTSRDVSTPIKVGFCSQLIRVHRCSSVDFKRMATAREGEPTVVLELSYLNGVWGGIRAIPGRTAREWPKREQRISNQG